MNWYWSTVAFCSLGLLFCFIMEGCVLNRYAPPLLYSESEGDFSAWVESMRSPSEEQTLNNIDKWCRSHMRYRADGVVDYFRHYLKAWNQEGDCEDFSAVQIEAMHRLGFTTYALLSVFYDGSGHTVCTNKKYHISNWGVYTINKNSYEEAAGTISGNWVKYIVRDKALNVLEEGER